MEHTLKDLTLPQFVDGETVIVRIIDKPAGGLNDITNIIWAKRTINTYPLIEYGDASGYIYSDEPTYSMPYEESMQDSLSFSCQKASSTTPAFKVVVTAIGQTKNGEKINIQSELEVHKSRLQTQ